MQTCRQSGRLSRSSRASPDHWPRIGPRSTCSLRRTTAGRIPNRTANPAALSDASRSALCAATASPSPCTAGRCGPSRPARPAGPPTPWRDTTSSRCAVRSKVCRIGRSSEWRPLPAKRCLRSLVPPSPATTCPCPKAATIPRPSMRRRSRAGVPGERPADRPTRARRPTDRRNGADRTGTATAVACPKDFDPIAPSRIVRFEPTHRDKRRHAAAIRVRCAAIRPGPNRSASFRRNVAHNAAETLRLVDTERRLVPAGRPGDSPALPLGDVPRQVGQQHPNPPGDDLAPIDQFQATELPHQARLLPPGADLFDHERMPDTVVNSRLSLFRFPCPRQRRAPARPRCRSKPGCRAKR